MNKLYNKEEHLFNLYLLLVSSFKYIPKIHQVINRKHKAYILYDIKRINRDKKEKLTAVSLSSYIAKSFTISIEIIRTLIRNIIEMADYCFNVIEAKNISIKNNGVVISSHLNPLLVYSSYHSDINSNVEKFILNDIKEMIYFVSTGNDYSLIYNETQETFLYDERPYMNIRKLLSYLQKGNYTFNEVKKNKFITASGNFQYQITIMTMNHH